MSHMHDASVYAGRAKILVVERRDHEKPIRLQGTSISLPLGMPTAPEALQRHAPMSKWDSRTSNLGRPTARPGYELERSLIDLSSHSCIDLMCVHAESIVLETGNSNKHTFC